MQNSAQHASQSNLIVMTVAFILGAVSIKGWESFVEFMEQPLQAPPRAFEGKCVRIIDGDRIVVAAAPRGTFTVNIVSAFAPGPGEPFYKEATEYATEMLLNQQVTVQPNHGVKRGEVDAWVYLGPLCFNNELVKAGLARWGHDDVRDTPVKVLEGEARKGKRGLWSKPNSINYGPLERAH